MNVETLVESARGTIWETALRGNHDGYVPPRVEEWTPDKAPIAYLEEGEQPHFMGVDTGRALKVRVGEDVDLEESSRVPFDDVQQGLMYEGQTGYLAADEPYSNILLFTDRRLLLIVGKEAESISVEFRYDDEDVNYITIGGRYNPYARAIHADGLEYKLEVEIVTPPYQYLHEETPLTVLELQLEAENNGSSDETENYGSSDGTTKAIADLTDLVSLTPEGFERYVADVWRSQGYSCNLTKGSGDGGIDIVADQGEERVLIQAKRYSEQNVGVETVQRTAGLLVDDEFEGTEVKIVTTSGFTADAKQRAQRISDLELINGAELVALGNKTGVGVYNENGEPVYPQEATPEQVLEVLKPGEPMTTAEVVSKIDAPQRTVIAQLKSLVEAGEIKAKQVGENRAVWYKGEA